MDRRLIYSDVAHQILLNGGNIDDVPTADNVTESVTGEWIASQPVEISKEWKCTACQGLVLLPVWTDHCYYNYCPNCGAKMSNIDLEKQYE